MEMLMDGNENGCKDATHCYDHQNVWRSYQNIWNVGQRGREDQKMMMKMIIEVTPRMKSDLPIQTAMMLV